MDPKLSPQALQRKVQFDLRLYFFRRGMENIQDMKKDHFKMEYNTQTESWTVVKNKDELTKNHKEIGSVVSGVMPENPTDEMCPVKSYATYIDHLNPDNPYLWQVPLRNVDMINDEIWFGLGHIGKNPLAKFMSDVSVNCGLSKIYTNHCIRVTGASILTRMQFFSIRNYVRYWSQISTELGHISED